MKQIKAVTYQTPRGEPTGSAPMIDDRLDGVRFDVTHVDQRQVLYVDRQQVTTAATSRADPDDHRDVGSLIATWPQQRRNGSSTLAEGEATSSAGDHVMVDLIKAQSMMIGFLHNFFEKSFHAL